MTKTVGLMPLPPSLAAKRAELERVERVGRAYTGAPARRLFAIERRRLLLAIYATPPIEVEAS